MKDVITLVQLVLFITALGGVIISLVEISEYLFFTKK